MKRRVFGASLLGVMLLSGTAFAGPKMTFGPNDEGALQLDYKGQFQMTVRDTGSGENNDDNTMNFNFRRNRLALMGKYGDNMSLYVQTEYVDDANITPLDVAGGICPGVLVDEVGAVPLKVIVGSGKEHYRRAGGRIAREGAVIVVDDIGIVGRLIT